MKSKVIKAFKCKDSKLIYQVGDTYEANAERIKELSTAGFTTPLPKPKKKAGETDGDKPSK